jgi:hypothetical protein
MIGIAIVIVLAAADADACWTRTTIAVDRAKLSRHTRAPVLSRAESWPVRAVAGVSVVARPPSVEVRLDDGSSETLAQTATADEAEDLAAALRAAVRVAARRRDDPQHAPR